MKILFSCLVDCFISMLCFVVSANGTSTTNEIPLTISRPTLSTRTIKKVALDDSNPTYYSSAVPWKQYDFMLVVEAQSGMLDMFLTGDASNSVLEGYSVFANSTPDKENFLGNLYELMSQSLQTSPNLPMISTENRVFTILANSSFAIDPYTDHQLFFRIRDVNTANCRTAYNVFAASTLTAYKDGIASEGAIADYCKLEILYANEFGLSPGLVLTKIEFSGSGNVLMKNGASFSKEIFSFGSQDEHSWENTYIPVERLSLLIPSQGELTVHFGAGRNSSRHQRIFDSSFSSIVMSPNYPLDLSTYKVLYDGILQFDIAIDSGIDGTAMFTFHPIDLQLSKNATLKVVTSDSTKMITTNETWTYEGEQVSIIYEFDKEGKEYGNFLIRYEVEVETKEETKNVFLIILFSIIGLLIVLFIILLCVLFKCMRNKRVTSSYSRFSS